MDVVKLAQMMYKEIESEIVAIERSLAGGSAKDFAEYKHLVGIVLGYRRTREILRELMSSEEDEEDNK